MTVFLFQLLADDGILQANKWSIGTGMDNS